MWVGPACLALHCWDASVSHVGYNTFAMERQVSIRLPTPLLNELDRRARRRKRTRAAVIRAALDAYVALPDGALEDHPAQRVRDLLGSVEGLPPDLAGNIDHHLADLGAHHHR
jgi:metal-responsive CopG/Arc/MetJ family transcriptional regulator